MNERLNEYRNLFIVYAFSSGLFVSRLTECRYSHKYSDITVAYSGDLWRLRDVEFAYIRDQRQAGADWCTNA